MLDLLLDLLLVLMLVLLLALIPTSLKLGAIKLANEWSFETSFKMVFTELWRRHCMWGTQSNNSSPKMLRLVNWLQVAASANSTQCAHIHFLDKALAIVVDAVGVEDDCDSTERVIRQQPVLRCILISVYTQRLTWSEITSDCPPEISSETSTRTRYEHVIAPDCIDVCMCENGGRGSVSSCVSSLQFAVTGLYTIHPWCADTIFAL